MKLLPCAFCRDTALAAKPSPSHPRGLFQSIGALHDSVLVFKCMRCERPQRITAAEFNLLPRMTPDQIEADTCDLPSSACDENPLLP